MARKNLAGLAALGALGMMMSKKKGADRDTDTGVDVQPSYGQSSGKTSMMDEKPSMMNDMGEIRDEEGTLSKLRRNTETGEMYDPTGSSMSAPSRLTSRSPSPRNVNYSNEGRSSVTEKNPSNPDYGNEGRRSIRPALDVGSSKDTKTYRDLSGNVKTQSADGAAAERAANRAMLAEKIKEAGSSFGDYMTDLGKKEEKHGTYVKDGKVVRYAKGGMTSSKMMSAPKVSSASKRADGIASKGKTRGKLC